MGWWALVAAWYGNDDTPLPDIATAVKEVAWPLSVLPACVV
jgi:hypothetical protein